MARKQVAPASAATAGLKQDATEIQAQTEAFCGSCHRAPRADYFARERWHQEVERGFRFSATSSRTDLSPPPLAQVVAYYRSHAPSELAISIPHEWSRGPIRFVRRDVASHESGSKSSPAISFLKSLSFEPGMDPVLIACDMFGGDLLAIDAGATSPVTKRIASLGHPAHAEPCDLDANGVTDLVVADLGSFLPEDHDRGRVLWLPNIAQSTNPEPVALLDGISRVADARPFDPDGDGDQDLVVAEFGWQTTGSIRMLENVTEGSATPTFRPRILDDRHGAIHVPVWDWDGDQLDDFCALISQEHETIEIFRSPGAKTLRREIVNPPEDPAFGSSGIELVDLDLDGDIDVLYTNGDTFDSYELKPYHGIQWIENLGGERWESHRLTAMAGVQRAVAGDLDGDGDLDIVAVSCLPDRALEGSKHTMADFDSIIWLEQTSPGRFARHRLEKGLCHHVALEVRDYNADERLDIAVGNLQAPVESPPVSLWLNVADSNDAL